MNYKLEKENNSKKIIILISVICCSIILVIGITTAYFTASKSSNTENIVTANINDTLIYNDSTTYMRQGLIPATESVAKQAYQRTEEGKKCLDSGNYSACSIYEFSIQNTAKVSQDLIIDMIPTVNTFTNLYFMLYEIDSEGNSSELVTSKQIAKLTDEIIQSKNIPTYNLREKITIKPNETKTYQIVFFINNTEVDQTLEDAGKKFGASIKITSIATGKYMIKTFGESCWQTELLSDGTYKLTEFYGINNDRNDTENYGNINESCTGYVSKDENDGFYSVNIPSNVGGKQISTLGYNLFTGVDFISEREFYSNNYSKIEKITINEGITTIEDGYPEPTNDGKFGGTFMYIGMDLDVTSGNVTPLTEVNIYIPDNSILTKIGNLAFTVANIKNITLPSNVQTIGDSAFQSNLNLTTVTFVGAEDGTSKLTAIGHSAFSNTQLSSVVIPSNVQTIGDSAFQSNSNLTEVTFVGAEDGTSNLTSIGGSAFYRTRLTSIVIPSSVETIGNGAFGSNSNLTTVTFVGAEDDASKLTTIGEYAFIYCNLTYTEETNPLILPSSITSIGGYAFNNNVNLNYIKFTRDTTGFGDSWNGSATIITE